MASAYTTPKYLSEQVAKDLGYSGDFGTGGVATWLGSQGKDVQDKYLANINQGGGKASGLYSIENNPLVNQSLPQLTASQVQNPQLPVGGELVPQLQSVNANELMPQGNSEVNPTGANVAAATPVTTPQYEASTAQAATTDPNAATAGLDPNAQTYTATTISGQTPQAVTGQMVVDPMATVQGQLDKLYADFDGGATPPWARAALQVANEEMAARGMGKSSIGAAAMVTAVQKQAINIAAADASTYFQADMATFNAATQAELLNTQLRQQSLLSDQSAENAAKQFNASSIGQLQQFQAQLVAQIQSQNADRITAISQFNAAEVNKTAAQNAANSIAVDTFNEQQKNQVNQFNAQVQSQREQFNAQMRFAIDQSNVLWRREINTANTASINAAAQSNVQNLFNMSQIAQNNLWQAWRDEASWAWQSQENATSRNFQLAYAANNQQFQSGLYSDASEQELYNLLGQFAFSSMS